MAQTDDVGRASVQDLLISLINRTVRIWQHVMRVLDQILSDLNLHEYLDKAALYVARHPIIALVIFAIAVTCGIPILMFILFAVVTVFLTFTGFVVVEGTILTVGSVLLCGFLMAMVIVLVTIASGIGVAYFGFLQIYGILQKSPDKSPLAQFLPNIAQKVSPAVKVKESGN